MTKEEVPPEWMWPYDDELKIWFELVEEKRAEKYGGDSSSGGIDGPSMQNELVGS